MSLSDDSQQDSNKLLKKTFVDLLVVIKSLDDDARVLKEIGKILKSSKSFKFIFISDKHRSLGLRE